LLEEKNGRGIDVRVNRTIVTSKRKSTQQDLIAL
jgi:hypothetical protein